MGRRTLAADPTTDVPLLLRARRLGDRREVTLDERPLARLAALGLLRHLEHRRPAEIAARRALGGLEVLVAVATGHAGAVALEAFDDERFHTRSIGRGG
jgi:hypothetical protein